MSPIRWSVAVAICAFIASTCPALACTVAFPRTYDPSGVFEAYSRDDIIKRSEVIVEGVIEPYNADNDLHFARMHVDRVWKGAVASDVVVIMGLYLAVCSSAPRPAGERIRFTASLVEKRLLSVKDAMTLTPDEVQLIETHDDFLIYSNLSRVSPTIDLPLEDPEFDRLLIAYQADTQQMQHRAESGDRDARLAYAAHLFDNTELHRALSVYETLLRETPSDLDLLLTLAIVRARVLPGDEPEATLSEVERKAPKTPEWQRKIIHARFAATGRLTPGWKDWADLKRAA